jgi:hypothetical protein
MSEIYRHFKTKDHYVVLMEAIDVETGEDTVIYKSMSSDKIYARNKEEFFGYSPNAMEKRFKCVTDGEHQLWLEASK